MANPARGLLNRECIALYELAYSTVQYRRGKQEVEEGPVSKHQIGPGDGTWTGRRGVARLNPRRENKIQGKNGDRYERRLSNV